MSNPNQIADPSLPRRLGTFTIPEDLIRENPALVAPVFAECVPVRAEFTIENLTFEYLAISPHFEPIPNWSTAPKYEVQFETDDDGNPVFLAFTPIRE